MIESAFYTILDQSIAAGYLILAVILVRWLFRKAPRTLPCVLWLMVGLRLVCPFSLESVYSLVPGQTVEDVVYSSLSDVTTAGTQTSTDTGTIVLQDSLAPTPEYSAEPIQIVLGVAAYVWALGVAVMLVYFAVSYLLLRRRLRTATPMLFHGEKLHGEKLYQSDRIRSPFLFGIVAPRIYVPYGVAEDELTYIVLHENAHRRHGDHIIKLIAFVLLAGYWFHPLVWAAYLLLGRDIEMACDERVVRGLEAQERSRYSQALLQCAVQERHISACPIAFGEVGVKARVKKILNYRKPAFWVIAAAVVVCAVVAVCFMTRPTEEEIVESSLTEYYIEDEAYDGEATTQVTEESYTPTEAVTQVRSGMYYAVIKVAKDQEAFYAPTVKIDTQDSSFTFSSSPLSSYKAQGTYTVEDNILTGTSDDAFLTIAFEINEDGTLEYLPDQSRNVSFDERFSYTFSTEEPSSEVIVSTLDEDAAQESDYYTIAQQWAEAFCNRDANTIREMATDSCETSLEEAGLLIEDGFGWSSPWPWFVEESRILRANYNGAEIWYYALTSDPHVTVWREYIDFNSSLLLQSGTVLNEGLTCYEDISSGADFYAAYPDGIIQGTAMDYYSEDGNGMGETLNELASRLGTGDLYEPDTAAVYLLNLLDDPDQVSLRVRVTGDSDTADVAIYFKEDDTTVTVTMIHPYGTDGIWVPWDAY